MAILLVIGVMDLRAMAVVAPAITVERLAPAGARAARRRAGAKGEAPPHRAHPPGRGAELDRPPSQGGVAAPAQEPEADRRGGDRRADHANQVEVGQPEHAGDGVVVGDARARESEAKQGTEDEEARAVHGASLPGPRRAG